MTGTSYWQALGETLAHPIDVLTSLLSPSEQVQGPPQTADTSFLSFLTNPAIPPVDSVASGAVRAYGVDPLTGALTSGITVAPQGYDPLNPMAFVNRVESDAVGFYNAQLAKNSAANNAADKPTNYVLLAVVGLVALILLLRVVR